MSLRDQASPSMFLLRRRFRRGQTLAEVLVAIAILSVIVVFVTADLTNITQAANVTDRSIEISGANFLIGVMKSDPGFWTNGNDWSLGPSETCLAPLGAYTDTGPSPSPSWHTMPTPPFGCPAYPFTVGGQPPPDTNGSPPPAGVGNAIEYMWNASEHQGDPFVADLTVWVRRDDSSPWFEYHSLRYESPSSSTPPPYPTPTPTPAGTPTPGGSPTPPPTPRPTPTTGPPTPTPSPTSIGI
jgi:prepilin-type N-terminal cleavage/methylation domain-containing protein